ncbi:alpha/beta fold hydrolase [Escherichia coli]|nr:alpha/beta fold hydrolase [Escherichia coli]
MNEVYVIAGGEWLRNNLNAIAAFMGTRTWDSIEKIALTLSVLAVAVMWVQRHNVMDLLGWVAVFVLISLLVNVRTSVQIIDNSDLVKVHRVDNVPVGLAMPLSLTTRIRDSEIQNFCLHGTVGAGKSEVIRRLANYARQRGDMVVIYDRSGEFVKSYYDPSIDKILNPLDARCAAWDLWKECLTQPDFDNTANTLIPMGTKEDPFWQGSGRTIFAEAAYLMRNDPNRSYSKLVDTLLSIKIEKLRTFLRNSPAANLVEEKIEKTAISIRAVLTNYVKAIRYLQGIEHNGESFIRNVLLPCFANAFTEAGFATITFDYRGFGESDGERGRLVPAMQTEDIISVINWAEKQECIDNQRIGLWGTSLGGGHVFSAAAQDQRVKCIVSQLAFADGDVLVTGEMNESERASFLSTLNKMAEKKKNTGKEMFVGVTRVLSDDESKVFFEKIKARHPEMDIKIPFLTVMETLQYKPAESAASVQCPVLVVIAGQDSVNPPEQGRALYDAVASGTKELYEEADACHYDIYEGAFFERVVAVQTQWFKQYL